MLLQDKVAVITGGAGPNGLGFATARLMAAHGAKVAVLDLARAQPAQAAAQLGADHPGQTRRRPKGRHHCRHPFVAFGQRQGCGGRLSVSGQ